MAKNEFRSPHYYSLKVKYTLKRLKLFRKLFAFAKRQMNSIGVGHIFMNN